jgi:hypothetical protein
LAAGDQIQSYKITKDFLVGRITEIMSWSSIIQKQLVEDLLI